MTEFNKFYASVVAACPAAEISGLIWKPSDGKFNVWGKWLRDGHKWTEDDVRAICLRKWTGMMREHEYLHRDPVGFSVWAGGGSRRELATGATQEECVGEYLKARKG